MIDYFKFFKNNYKELHNDFFVHVNQEDIEFPTYINLEYKNQLIKTIHIDIPDCSVDNYDSKIYKSYYFKNKKENFIEKDCNYLQIFKEEFNNKFKKDAILSEIYSMVNNPIIEDPNRTTYITEISKEKTKEFLENNSLYELKIGNIRLGRYDNKTKELIGVININQVKKNRSKIDGHFKVVSFCDKNFYHEKYKSSFIDLIKKFKELYSECKQLHFEIDLRFYNRFLNEFIEYKNLNKINLEIKEMDPQYYLCKTVSKPNFYNSLYSHTTFFDNTYRHYKYSQYYIYRNNLHNILNIDSKIAKPFGKVKFNKFWDCGYKKYSIIYI